jgi:hypothetical protein
MGSMNKYAPDGVASRGNTPPREMESSLQVPKEHAIPEALHNDKKYAKMPLTPPYDVAEE